MKALSPILSGILILAIVLSTASTLYLWGLPLLEKKSSSKIVLEVFEKFNPTAKNSFPRILAKVVREGEAIRFDGGIKGLWEIYPNSIQFTFVSKVSNFAVGEGWISLTGEECKSFVFEEGFPFVVCVKANKIGTAYNLTYKTIAKVLNLTKFEGKEFYQQIEFKPNFPEGNRIASSSIRIKKIGTREISYPTNLTRLVILEISI